MTRRRNFLIFAELIGCRFSMGRNLVRYGKKPRTLWEETFYAMGSVSVSYG